MLCLLLSQMLPTADAVGMWRYLNVTDLCLFSRVWCVVQTRHPRPSSLHQKKIQIHTALVSESSLCWSGNCGSSWSICWRSHQFWKLDRCSSKQSSWLFILGLLTLSCLCVKWCFIETARMYDENTILSKKNIEVKWQLKRPLSWHEQKQWRT